MSVGIRLRCTAAFLLILVIVLVVSSPVAAQNRFSLDDVSHLFPSQGFERQIDFWKKVFTEVRVTEVIFHDLDDPRLIYMTETFARRIDGDPAETRRQREFLKDRLKHLKSLFDDIRRYGPDSSELRDEHRRVVRAFRDHGYRVDDALLRARKEKIRYQRGVREKFRESLIRSGMYLHWIEETFERYGLPSELAVIPHVESSFDYNAYSHAGAAGIWQFTRGTGRSYMQISSVVDERLDPIRATEAAARLLSENYALLGNWPLAITSYNHGRNGMRRAKELHGDDLRVIIREYKSKYFGFASSNFYAEFLAALLVAKNSDEFFGPLSILPPLRFDTVQLTKSYDVSYFTSIDGITDQVLRDLNPHLKRILEARRRVIPAGIEVRVPDESGPLVEAVLASARPAGREAMVAADGSVRYRIEEGDSLGAIASELNVPANEILRLNRLSNPNLIFPGQVLLIKRASSAPGTTTRIERDSPLETATPVPVSGSETIAYTVRNGDNLALLAKRFGTTVAALQSLNRLPNPNLLRTGMQLEIPGSATSSVSAPRRYTVRPGDTLVGIAQRFKTSVERIQEHNGINNPNRIRNGQELLIP